MKICTPTDPTVRTTFLFLSRVQRNVSWLADMAAPAAVRGLMKAAGDGEPREPREELPPPLEPAIRPWSRPESDMPRLTVLRALASSAVRCAISSSRVPTKFALVSVVRTQPTVLPPLTVT